MIPQGFTKEDEVRERRTLTSSHYTKDGNTFINHFYVGHQFYNDKLGGTGLRSIDWTLSFDEIKRGWFFNYHFFRPFLPEYADGWVEFRDLFDDKDQTIKYRAHASHTLGRLVQPSEIGLERETQVNCVIYDNAFGEGKDYVLYFTRSALKKVVRIREKYKGTTDQKFIFDIDFPKDNGKVEKIIRTENKEVKDTAPSYELDITKDKVFNTNKYTLIGNDKGNGKEWFTYLKPFKCWDSGGKDEKRQIINVEYSANNKTLTKIVPASFLVNSYGDIFADTTTSYYCSSDGYVNYVGDGNSWATCHDAASGLSVANDTTDLEVRSRKRTTTPTYDIQRGFATFVTSGIGAGATITGASFNGKILETSDQNNDGNDFISVVQSTQASPTTLVTGDYNKAGTTEAHDTSERKDISSGMTVGQYSVWTFNATGIGFINKTGNTLLAFREGHDLLNSAPGTVGYSYIAFYSFSTAGTTSDPYLSVITASAATARRRFIRH